MHLDEEPLLCILYVNLSINQSSLLVLVRFVTCLDDRSLQAQRISLRSMCFPHTHKSASYGFYCCFLPWLSHTQLRHLKACYYVLLFCNVHSSSVSLFRSLRLPLFTVSTQKGSSAQHFPALKGTVGAVISPRRKSQQTIAVVRLPTAVLSSECSWRSLGTCKQVEVR